MGGWSTYKLGAICEIARGGSPRPIEKYITSNADGVNWIKIGDATKSKKYIYETEQKITKDGISRSRLVKAGDFLLSNSMSFGRPYIMRTEGCIHDGWLVISHYQDYLDQDFLYYLLSSPNVTSQFEHLAQGSTVRNLNKELVGRVTISIPFIPLQKAIVAKLDAAFASIDTAIAAAEKNAENAKQLFQSYLSDVFEHRDNRRSNTGAAVMGGWKTFTLGEVCTFLNGSTPSKTNTAYWENGDVNWFTINDLRNQGREIYETEQKVTALALADTSLKMMPENTVLLCCTASLGATALTRVPTTSNQQFVGLVPKSGILNADFLYYYCLTLTDALHKVSGSATIAYVANSKLKTISIPLPPLPIQKAIVAKLDELITHTIKLSELHKTKSSSFNALKQSLLQQAFSGQLVDA